MGRDARPEDVVSAIHADLGAFPDAGVTVEISVSVGGVLAAAYEDADEVLTRADDAVYRAKHAGRDQVSLDVGGS